MEPLKRFNRTVLVTGSSKGIGKEIATRLLDSGYKVIGCSRQTVDLGNKEYLHFNADVANNREVQSLFAELRKSRIKLYGLINNAGIASMNHFLTTPIDTARRIMDTNYIGTLQMMQQGARLMTGGQGRIVNFTSVAKPLDLEGESVYASSKAAIETLTRITSRELAPFGVTVNAIGPTPIWTDLIKSVPSEKLESLLSRQAIKRLGEFEDVWNCVEFLISEKSNFVTGQVIYLGGV